MPCENVSSGLCQQRRFRSACASAQSDLGLYCPPTRSFDTTECMNGEKRSGWYFVHAQYDLNLRNLRIFEGTFSFDAALINVLVYSKDLYQILRTLPADLDLTVHIRSRRHSMIRDIIKSVFGVKANCKDPDQPAVIYSLIRNFDILHHVLQDQWFYRRTAKVLIRLRIRAVWSGPSLSVYAWRNVFAWRDPYFVVARIVCGYL